MTLSRGFASATYLESAARTIKEQRRPAHLYYLGDWDPPGKMIPEKIEAAIRGFAPGCEVHFHRLLVTPVQVREWRLTTKPPKESPHSAGFEGGIVEAEAIPADVTRRLLREAIESHLDMREVAGLEAAEESEREWLNTLADKLEDAA